ncbi:MAG: protein of unknown function [Nitrospira sp.]
MGQSNNNEVGRANRLAMTVAFALLGASVGVDVQTALASSSPSPMPPEGMRQSGDRMKPDATQQKFDPAQKRIDAPQQKLPSVQQKDLVAPGMKPIPPTR